jgi:hypothetical protein
MNNDISDAVIKTRAVGLQGRAASDGFELAAHVLVGDEPASASRFPNIDARYAHRRVMASDRPRRRCSRRCPEHFRIRRHELPPALSASISIHAEDHPWRRSATPTENNPDSPFYQQFQLPIHRRTS